MARREALVMIDGHFWQKPPSDYLNLGMMSLGSPNLRLISNNAINIGAANTNFVQIISLSATELRTIDTLPTGTLIVLMRHPSSSGIDITNAGNIRVPGTISTTAGWMGSFIYDGTNWRMLGYSNNT